MYDRKNYETSIFKDIASDHRDRILAVRSFFPELDGVKITFRYLAPGSRLMYSGWANWNSNTISLSPTIFDRNAVIAHELTHILQHQYEGIPQGEKSCEIWTLARSPLLNDMAPGYLELPREMKNLWNREDARYCNEVALMAIKFREQGKRQYIKWFEETVKIGTFFKREVEVVDRKSVV